MKKLLLGVLLLWLPGCNIDKDTRVNKDEPKFRTTDSSVLFFKNVRQLYYDKETNEAAKIDQYRISRRVQDPQLPVLNLIIVHNWRQDQAYIFLEPNVLIKDLESFTINWKDTTAQKEGTYYYEPGPKEAQFTFAVELYTSIQEGHQMELLAGGQAIPFLASYEEKEAFRITMVDFLRLVNILK